MSKNVLVIERDFETSRQIAKALEGEGYFVFTASSAEAGLVMARRVKPSLLFLNLLMRDAGGVEFLKKLRALDFLHNVPILLLTQKQEEYETKYGNIYGIVNFVNLPVDENEVIAKSRASLEQIPVHDPSVRDEPAAKDPVVEDAPPLSQDMGAGRSFSEHQASGYTGAEASDPASHEDGIHHNKNKNESAPRVNEDINENFIVRIDVPSVPSKNGVSDEGPDGDGEDIHSDKGGPDVRDIASSGAGLSSGTADNAGDSGSAFEASMREETLLFEEKEMEEQKTETKAEVHVPIEESVAGPTAGDRLIPEERKGGMEDIMPSAFHVQKKKKSVISKGVLWTLGIVLLGAASSFFFLMYMSPKKPGSGNVQAAPLSSENQPVIVEQNTPSVAAPPVNSAAPGQQKPQAANTAQQNQKQPAARNNSQTAKMGQVEAKGQAKLNPQVKVAGPKAAVQNQKTQILKPAPQNNKVIAASSAGAAEKEKDVKTRPLKAAHKALSNGKEAASSRSAQVRKEHKSPGYWALLEQEEAQMKNRDSDKGKAIEEKPAKKTGTIRQKRQKPAKKMTAHRSYSLQAGAFASRVNAEKLSGKLKAEGFKTYVLKSEKAGKPIYKVLVGRFSAPAEGDATARKLEKEGLKTFHYYE